MFIGTPVLPSTGEAFLFFAFPRYFQSGVDLLKDAAYSHSCFYLPTHQPQQQLQRVTDKDLLARTFTSVGRSDLVINLNILAYLTHQVRRGVVCRLRLQGRPRQRNEEGFVKGKWKKKGGRAIEESERQREGEKKEAKRRKLHREGVHDKGEGGSDERKGGKATRETESGGQRSGIKDERHLREFRALMLLLKQVWRITIVSSALAVSEKEYHNHNCTEEHHDSAEGLSTIHGHHHDSVEKCDTAPSPGMDRGKARGMIVPVPRSLFEGSCDLSLFRSLRGLMLRRVVVVMRKEERWRCGDQKWA